MAGSWLHGRHAVPTRQLATCAGTADLQIMVAKDIIPDLGFLAKCFEELLMEMKNVATKLQS
ncbi:O-acyltransferase WSD1, C-terminal [Dillenia turbinata]|uniref:O-acyltransferase WSD1, C-terminal n=1 Tax=Dillenia turbinata TaxID=194707 RepID=A0AAN8VH22_9MAGN